MAWYAAHCVLKFESSEPSGGVVEAYENVYLIDAASTDEAERKASSRAKLDEAGAPSGFEVDGRPARLVFAGVRKLISLQRASDRVSAAPELPDDQPEDRAELTYSRLRFSSDAELSKFLRNEGVTAQIVE